jgi:hypothetical protein
MRDIDLIPGDYLAMRRARRRLAAFAAVLVLVIGVAAAARVGIALRLDTERAAFEKVRRQGKVTDDQGVRLAALRVAKAAGDVQLGTLRTLLDGTTPEALWRGIDGAYHDRIWLDSVSYVRTVHAAPATPGAGTAAAAPAVPASAGAEIPAPPVVLRHDAELRGYGLDHAAVTDFMRALGERPGIGAVRLADSGLKPFAAIEVVGFGVSATLGTRQGDGR